MFNLGIDKPNSFDSNNDFITTEPMQESEPTSDDIAVEETQTVDHNRPPGRVGDLANHIYWAAYKPVKEIALAASLAYNAAVFGRGYNINGTGLNLYICLLAETGTGKEGAISGMTRFHENVRMQVPSLNECISPNFASPQAINRYMAQTSPCFVTIIPEIGIHFQKICGKNANPNDKGIKQVYLAGFNKSGHGDIAQGSVFADGTKDLKSISSPSLSIFGDSTPQEFYKGLDETSIADGLIPRFIICQYPGGRPPSNHNRIIQPDAAFLNSFAEAAAYIKAIENRNQVVNVQFDSQQSYDFSIEFENECDGKINAAKDEITRQLYNRAHLNMLKVAALIAVGVNHIQPLISIEHLVWAKIFVNASLAAVTSRFESGKVGEVSPHIIQHEQLLKCLKEYLKKDWQSSFIRNYGITQDHKNKRVITYRYIHNMLHKRPAFRNAHNPKQALDNMIQQFVSAEYLAKVAPRGMEKYRGTSVADMWIIINTG